MVVAIANSNNPPTYYPNNFVYLAQIKQKRLSYINVKQYFKS